MDGFSCSHINQPRDRKLLDFIAAQIETKRIIPTVHVGAGVKPPQQEQAGWNDRRYDLTCDDIAKNPVPVDIHKGKGTATGDKLGSDAYKRWEVKVQQIVHGSLPKLGKVTAVLFSCSPQPSNFAVQELHVYRTDDGNKIGRTPTFDVSGLSPQYQEKTVAFENGHLASDVKFYGPDDGHATGPSIRRHVTWTWNGQRFDTHHAEPEAEAPGRVDLSRQPITVDGMGPLKMGMSRTKAEKAVAAPIPDGPGGPHCTDLTVKGGPEGLVLRFARDKLVAISVLPSGATSISTASGIHRGSTREEVLRVYAGQISSHPIDSSHPEGGEELVFAPKAPEFKNKIIKFHTTDGKVETFIAGDRNFAELLPCGGD
ncbi:hypothetical protein ABZW18_00395 [Streptomyces sp. NPDC004647]|uniref:hypothetical protein n=1 Tax=Streptomyces sp. NPDC004647 TaxID=3154671 RepID=UPI0033B8FA80